jgi:hypothetical protein
MSRMVPPRSSPTRLSLFLRNAHATSGKRSEPMHTDAFFQLFFFGWLLRFESESAAHDSPSRQHAARRSALLLQTNTNSRNRKWLHTEFFGNPIFL